MKKRLDLNLGNVTLEQVIFTASMTLMGTVILQNIKMPNPCKPDQYLDFWRWLELKLCLYKNRDVPDIPEMGLYGPCGACGQRSY